MQFELCIDPVTQSEILSEIQARGMTMESSAGQATFRTVLERSPQLMSKLMSRSLVNFLSISKAHCLSPFNTSYH